MLKEFAQWLTQTGPSQVVQNVLWMIPAFQAVHILSIGILATSLAVVDAKLIGVGAKSSLAYLQRRFMPWIWVAAGVLVVSGTVLVVGEPKRELLNVLFRLKILLVAVLLTLVFVVQATVKRDEGFWTASKVRTATARLIGAGSLVILLAVITCGRWIAYAGMDAGS